MSRFTKKFRTRLLIILALLLAGAGGALSTWAIYNKSTLTLLFAISDNDLTADFQRGRSAYKKDDYAAALREFRPLAKKGHADAQDYLGWMYNNGQGVKQNYKEAAKWYRRAAEQGHAIAQADLGWMHQLGNGVLKDYNAAVKWYRLSAEQGNSRGQYYLGMMYYEGKGVPRESSSALNWFWLAAKQGSYNAQYILGETYEKGQHTLQNYITAYMWYNLAASSGDGGYYDSQQTRAINSREAIAKRMTPSEITEAQRRAAAFAAENY